jgi:hypothetical protein
MQRKGTWVDILPKRWHLPSFFSGCQRCRAHPDRKLYLCYFGIANPIAYGLRYVNLPGGWPFAPETDFASDATCGAMAAWFCVIYCANAHAQRGEGFKSKFP